MEILVSFWFKNWDHMSWMYGEGLSDRIRRVVFDFLAILPCDFFILLDLLFGILCDLSHSLNRSKLYIQSSKIQKSKNPPIHKHFHRDTTLFFFISRILRTKPLDFWIFGFLILMFSPDPRWGRGVLVL